MRTRRATLAAALVAAALSAPGASGTVGPGTFCFGAAALDTHALCQNPELRYVAVPMPDEAVLQPSFPCTREPSPPWGGQHCSFGVPASRARVTVVLIGDSHAVHWGAAVDAVARARHWHGQSFTRTGCPLSVNASSLHYVCRGWAAAVIRWLRQHSSIHVVFVSASAHPRVFSAYEWRVSGFLDAWRLLPSSVHHLFVIRDTEHVGVETAACVRSAVFHHRQPGPACARSRKQALFPDPEAAAAERTRQARVHLIDLTGHMCDEDRCYPVVGGALVTKDTTHMTRTFAETLGPYLLRAVDRLL